MIHAFLLFVYVGAGANEKLVSKDMYFRNVNECIYFAQRIHKQGKTIRTYCVPKFIDEKKVKVY